MHPQEFAKKQRVVRAQPERQAERAKGAPKARRSYLGRQIEPSV
jgi:hypothetical protein